MTNLNYQVESCSAGEENTSMCVRETKIPRVNSSREEQIQFLRFIAFLNVFLLHIGDFCFFPYPAWNGAVSAVTFFFMLSGALTGYAAYGKEITVNGKRICKHLWKKALKMYPLCFMTTLFYALLSKLPTVLVDCDFQTARSMINQLLRNLLMIQSWFKEGYFSFNGGCWYLSTSMFLFLLNLPVSAWLNWTDKKKYGKWCFAAVIFLSVGITVGYSIVTYPSENVHFWQYVFPPARIGQYCIGMILGYMIRGHKNMLCISKNTKLLFTLLEAAALVFWFCALLLPSESWHNRLVDWILPNCLLIGIFLYGQGWISQLFRMKPLVFWGDISFECYLLHQPVITLLAYQEPHNTTGYLICIGLCLGATVITAIYLNPNLKIGSRKA